MQKKLVTHKVGLCDIEHNRCQVSERLIISICQTFYVNEEWLRTGNGEIFKNNKKQTEFFEIFENINPVLQEFLIKVAKDLLETQDKL